MNKRLFSILLTLLLLMALLPAAAFAEGNIVVNLGSVRAGSSLDLQMATTDSGTASLSGGSLPDNCSIVTEDRGGSAAHYLRGTPGLAGNYEFTLAVTDTVEVPVEGGGEGGGEGEGEGEGEGSKRRGGAPAAFSGGRAAASLALLRFTASYSRNFSKLHSSPLSFIIR
ncbi:MAG: hypothetical protein IJL51_09310 [Oscillospiraceae bacterium]|nr:hypothetical protein [Oscillospiraceae bacterium]